MLNKHAGLCSSLAFTSLLPTGQEVRTARQTHSHANTTPHKRSITQNPSSHSPWYWAPSVGTSWKRYGGSLEPALLTRITCPRCSVNESWTGHTQVPPTLDMREHQHWFAIPTGCPTASCSVCAQSKTPRQLPEGLLEPLPIPQRPWSHISEDFVTDLASSQGYTTVLIIIYRFAKACRLVALKGLPTAMETATQLFHCVFLSFGIPEDIVSDRGSQFTSRLWHKFCKRLDINVSLTSGYHPQSKGQVERLNQEIGRYLCSYCWHEQDGWSEFLPWAEYAQYALTHSSTAHMPFQCLLGYQPLMFTWLGEPSTVPTVVMGSKVR